VSPSGRPRDNRAELVGVTVAGLVAPVRLDPDGPLAELARTGRRLPAAGGIALGVHATDPVGRWLADHLVPGASVSDAEARPSEPGALHLLACVGDRVRTADGHRLGIVAGKRGGIAPGFIGPQLVGVEATDAALDGLAPGDRIVIETTGRGLALPDHPAVSLANLAPVALDALDLRETGATLTVAVRAVVPSTLAAAGLGSDSWVGDLEIDDREDDRLPDDLRFGDLVAFGDLDASTTRFHRVGHVALGLVSHGPSRAAGHGVGVTILLSGPAVELRLEVRDEASLGPWLRAAAAAG
jgi:hypothetical protein